MSFADKLKKSRNDNGISQEQLAEALGVSRQCITKWESHIGYPEMQKALLLAAYLNISLDWLFESELRELGRDILSVKKENSVLEESNKMALHSMDDDAMSSIIENFMKPIVNGIVPTGLSHLDSQIAGGMHRGNTYYVLGAPEIGKLAFVLSIVNNIISNNGKVTLYLREHSAKRVLNNLISISAEADTWVSSDTYSEEDCKRVKKAQELYFASSLLIDDSYGDSVEQIYEKCINLPLQDLIVVDSARLLYSNTPDTSKGMKNRVERVLNDISRECRCPVIAIDRLDKEAEMHLVMNEDSSWVLDEIESNPNNMYMYNIWVMHRESYYNVNRDIEKPVSIIIKDIYSAQEGLNNPVAELTLNEHVGKVYDTNVK